jgi:hypothetical protein
MSALALDPVVALPIGPPPPAPDVPIPMPPPPQPGPPPEGDPPPAEPPFTDPGFPPPVIDPPPPMQKTGEVPFGKAHARRLREIYRSAGWPCCDTIEVELLAGGFLERVRTPHGHETCASPTPALHALPPRSPSTARRSHRTRHWSSAWHAK